MSNQQNQDKINENKEESHMKSEKSINDNENVVQIQGMNKIFKGAKNKWIQINNMISKNPIIFLFLLYILQSNMLNEIKLKTDEILKKQTQLENNYNKMLRLCQFEQLIENINKEQKSQNEPEMTNQIKLENQEDKINNEENFCQTYDHQQNSQNNLIGTISQNISLSMFSNFELIYNENFEKILSKKVFEQLSDKIFDTNIDPLLCIGAEKDQIFKVVACDLATEIFQETKNKYLARPSNNGQIFWYNFPDKSFGFSSSEFINLNVCDRENPQDDLRLCLSIQPQNNERRIGNLINQKEIQDYNLRIYMNKQ